MNILLVEDNEGDRRLMFEAFRTTAPQTRFHLRAVQDGDEAMDYLKHKGPFKNAPAPDLIILDLNLPKKNGAEILAEIKSDKDLHFIPVAVLTSSQSPKDIRACYERHASCYLTKPSGYQELLDLVKSIQAFWLEKVNYCSCRHAA